MLSGIPTRALDGTDYTYTVSDADNNAAVGDMDTLTFAISVDAASDHMPAAWLARFGRAVAEQVLDAVTERLGSTRAPGHQEATLAGQQIDLSGEMDHGPQALSMSAKVPADFVSGPHRFSESRTMTGHEVLIGTSFALTGERDSAGGTLALWGRTASTSFGGKDGRLTLDGNVTTLMVGADYARDEWLAGLALTRSDGDGTYSVTGAGKVESSLTAAVPYAAWRASERLNFWGAAGFGTGEVTLTPDKGERIEADIDWTMAAAGARGELLGPETGPTLTMVADALWARTISDGAKVGSLAAADADVTRLRLGLEGGWTIAMDAAGTLEPTLEAGVRHDGGDAETGFGVEVGSGLAWKVPAIGLALDVAGRTLVAHEDGGTEDKGFSAGLAFDPAADTGLGPSLFLRHDNGGESTGGLEALFASDPLASRSSTDAIGRWTAEAAWGFPAFGGLFTGSPHIGVGVVGTSHDYSAGWRFAPVAAPDAPDLSFGILATRRESESGGPEHGIGIEFSARW